MEVFETKVRRVGSSMGVLIPAKVLEGARVKEGDEVSIGILKKDVKAIGKMFGSGKGRMVFERDHKDRF